MGSDKGEMERVGMFRGEIKRQSKMYGKKGGEKK